MFMLDAAFFRTLGHGLVASPWDVDGGVTATGVLSRERGNLITIGNTQ